MDGGIDRLTVGEVVTAGADDVVAGSAVFNASASPAENIGAIRQAAHANEAVIQAHERTAEQY